MEEKKVTIFQITILRYASIWKGLSFHNSSSQQGYGLLSLVESYWRTSLDLSEVTSITLYSTQYRQKQILQFLETIIYKFSYL